MIGLGVKYSGCWYLGPVLFKPEIYPQSDTTPYIKNWWTYRITHSMAQMYACITKANSCESSSESKRDESWMRSSFKWVTPKARTTSASSLPCHHGFWQYGVDTEPLAVEPTYWKYQRYRCCLGMLLRLTNHQRKWLLMTSITNITWTLDRIFRSGRSFVVPGARV